MVRTLKYLGIAAAGLVLAGAAQAIPLSDLLQGQTIQAGDKLFDQFTLRFLEASDPALAPDLSDIDVTALADGGLDPGPGLLFTVLDDALTVAGDGTFAFIDLEFSFHVSVLDPVLRIKDNLLAFQDPLTPPTAPPPGAALTNPVEDTGVIILEGLFAAAPPAGALPDVCPPDCFGDKGIELSFLEPDLLIDVPSDEENFSNRSELWVIKDILVWATNADESASLYGFVQRFSQVAPTPEPATLALLAAGLAGVGFSTRRRRARAG
jgi:hypothetical protein